MKPTLLLLLCTVVSAFGANESTSPAKPDAPACCQAKPAPKTEEKSCCAPAAKPAPACCATAPIENPQSKIENLSKSSLFQADATFTDDSGKPFALSALRGHPVALNMFFAACGYACPLTVTDMLAMQNRLPAELRPKAIFVLVSFDVTRDTTEALAKYRTQRGLNEQWILLRGTDDSVRELAALLGVKFKQETDGAFAHSNLVTILNREGEIVHQRTGLQGGLDEATAALAAAMSPR